MKISLGKQEDGSALAVTLVMAITIGTVLGCYLSLVGNRYELTMRSQCWNTCIPVLEAGIEDALTHLQDDTNNYSANGWTAGTIGGQPTYTKQRTFSDGSYYYAVIYNLSTSSPYIYSTGFVPAPRNRNTYISRTAKVSGTAPPLLYAGMATVYSITLNGNGVAVDSFNSGNTNQSTGYLYDSKKAGTNGSVASVFGPVSLGNHTIEGNLYLGPGVSPPSKGTVTGQTYTDYNVSYPDVTLPSSSSGWNSLLPAVTNISGTQYRDFKTAGDYTVSDNVGIIVEPGITVRINATSTSYSPSNIHLKGTNGVSGTLDLYQTSGSGTINNVVMDIPQARYFYYYGMPGVTSMTYNGSSSGFIGVIYAPEATLTLNGGGGGGSVSGATVTKSITLNGSNWAFHFDEDLLTSGPTRGFVVTSWQEI